MNNPAKAASEFLTGPHDGEYGNFLRSLFKTEAGQPANMATEPLAALTTDYSNKEFRAVGRINAASQNQAPGLHTAASLRPALDSNSGVFARADKLHAEKLNTIAEATMNTFKARASGQAVAAHAANLTAKPDDIRASASRPQAKQISTPISYTALEVDMT